MDDQDLSQALHDSRNETHAYRMKAAILANHLKLIIAATEAASEALKKFEVAHDSRKTP